MKKYWMIAFGAAAALACTLAGCTSKNDVYADLNECAKSNYTAVELSVSTDTAGDSLSGTYKAVSVEGGVTVTYSFEQFNLIEKEGDTYVVPDTAKSVLSGSMTVKDGKVVEQNGAAADLAITTVTAAGMKFEANNFENVVAADGSFKADVKNASAFLSTELTCTGMKVEVVYQGKAFKTVNLSYSTANASVTLSYNFS